MIISYFGVSRIGKNHTCATNIEANKRIGRGLAKLRR